MNSNYKQGIDSEMVDLVNAMNAGQVGALILQGVNPSYEYFDAAKFDEGLKKVKTTISLNDRLDETTDQMVYKSARSSLAGKLGRCRAQDRLLFFHAAYYCTFIQDKTTSGLLIGMGRSIGYLPPVIF
ncbi:MAG: hypothetical protein KL787_07755 [Taibaiella sp.]|nr:hypothetical protein [Taibaiella sp.]